MYKKAQEIIDASPDTAIFYCNREGITYITDSEAVLACESIMNGNHGAKMLKFACEYADETAEGFKKVMEEEYSEEEFNLDNRIILEHIYIVVASRLMKEGKLEIHDNSDKNKQVVSHKVCKQLKVDLIIPLAPDKLDLGLITQEEYDKLKIELSNYIK